MSAFSEETEQQLDEDCRKGGGPELKKQVRGTRRRHGCHHPHSLVSVNVFGKRSDDSLKANGWIRDKPFFMTIDTEAAVTIAGPDITVRLP
jgi:hypothetical protein